MAGVDEGTARRPLRRLGAPRRARATRAEQERPAPTVPRRDAPVPGRSDPCKGRAAVRWRAPVAGVGGDGQMPLSGAAAPLSEPAAPVPAPAAPSSSIIFMKSNVSAAGGATTAAFTP